MKTLLDVFYPRTCILCDCRLEAPGYLCPECRKEAPFFKNSKTKRQFLDSFTGVWYYEGYVRESLHRFKFQGGTYLAPAYGCFLAARIRQVYPEGFDVLTWVPTSPIRTMERGYDQCRLLAKAVGRELHMRPRGLLFKIRHNPAQSGLSDASQRRGNVSGAYVALQKKQFAGKRVLLLDDILTTGATAGECARVLKTAGAAQVHCAVVAVAEKA